ncbi:MAG: sugar transferase [Alphaproteobacteria bacterium]|uniref:Sugar transferase n=1 Tax=Candidatus Nitrobium versatile TaxID=2884831 RepID=A0A953JGQ8_9BACT|nr:sugar transferase [Candidatus Nitrobium versatile]
MYDFVKRLMDVFLGIFFLITFSPLFFLVALLIKLDSEGPVFFRQKRCGKGGREFFMYKFRTMVKNAEALKKALTNEVDGPMFKVKNDPRITKIGRILRQWSLDELPQLINVVKGEMSLVGPRPLAKNEMPVTEEELPFTKDKTPVDITWKETRLRVKPGMTGLWQVKGRGSGKFSCWIKYDVEYVQKRSVFLDMKILFLTLNAVLRRKGAD